MKNKILYIALFLSMVFVFSGCIERKLILDKPEPIQSQNNRWAEETNEEENVDISDLEQESADKEEQTEIIEQSQPPKIPRIDFPVSEYAKLARSGKATIKGTIYVQTSLGERVFGKNTRLYLNPVTSYSEQWYNESYLDGNKMEKADSRLFNYLRFTASNKNGEFAFYGVPSGSYYLIGTVKCALECGYDKPKSIRIAAHVSVEGNQVLLKDLMRHVD